MGRTPPVGQGDNNIRRLAHGVALAVTNSVTEEFKVHEGNRVHLWLPEPRGCTKLTLQC